MSYVGVNHDLRCVDGKTLHMPPYAAGTVGAGLGNLTLPNVYSSSTTQLYPIGTRFVYGERVFRYCYFGNAISPCLRGLVSYLSRTNASSLDSYDSSQPEGTTELKIDGVGTGNPAVNAYAGHYIGIWAAGTIGRVTMRVLSSTASAADPLNAVQTFVCTLDQPTPIAVAADTPCDLFPSRFADVRSTYTEMTGYLYPFVGVALRLFDAADYGWVQTWGPVYINSSASEEPGTSNFSRTVVFHTDGSIQLAKDTWGNASATSHQYAGYTLATDGRGSEWTMLMLDA